jgi:hypothetical protein
LPPMRIELPMGEARSASAPPEKMNQRPALSERNSKVDLPSKLGGGGGLGGGPGLERSTTTPVVGGGEKEELSERPPLIGSKTTPGNMSGLQMMDVGDLRHNAWAEEFGEEFGKEGEMKMTFE